MKEQDLQTWVGDYLRIQYPFTLWHADFGSGTKLTPAQAMRQKRQNGGIRGYPDLFIIERTAEYAGLFIELKRDGVHLKKKNGEWATTHIAEQAEMLERLECRGFKATFAVGFDEAKEIIDNYLKEAQCWK